MVRKAYLEKTLPTWLKIPQIEKVIVVDWGAKEDLSELCTDVRVEIVSVPDKKTFEQGETWNVGIRRVQSDYVFMVDIDVLFNAESLALKKLLERIIEGQYAENSYIVCAVWPNHLTGTCIFPKAMIDKANGFIEKLPTRGSEEIDLRNRCDKAGAVRKYDLWPGMIEHIDHDDAARFENMSEEINILEADKINQRAISEIDVTKQARNPVLCNIHTLVGLKKGVMV
jgi:glycosyltransferase involved in cell wall biosynthesis